MSLLSFFAPACLKKHNTVSSFSKSRFFWHTHCCTGDYPIRSGKQHVMIRRKMPESLSTNFFKKRLPQGLGFTWIVFIESKQVTDLIFTEERLLSHTSHRFSFFYSYKKVRKKSVEFLIAFFCLIFCVKTDIKVDFDTYCQLTIHSSAESASGIKSK